MFIELEDQETNSYVIINTTKVNSVEFNKVSLKSKIGKENDTHDKWELRVYYAGNFKDERCHIRGDKNDIWPIYQAIRNRLLDRGNNDSEN
jgi:hypothetical protein